MQYLNAMKVLERFSCFRHHQIIDKRAVKHGIFSWCTHVIKGFIPTTQKKLFDISKVTIIMTCPKYRPKYGFPNIFISKFVGNQSSRFPAILSILYQIQKSHRSIHGSLRL